MSFSLGVTILCQQSSRAAPQGKFSVLGKQQALIQKWGLSLLDGLLQVMLLSPAGDISYICRAVSEISIFCSMWGLFWAVVVKMMWQTQSPEVIQLRDKWRILRVMMYAQKNECIYIYMRCLFQVCVTLQVLVEPVAYIFIFNRSWLFNEPLQDSVSLLLQCLGQN